MNITNVLHRSKTGGAGVALHTRPEPAPPNVFSLDRDPGGGTQWPRGGVVLVALLAIAAVLGAVGTAAGFASSDDGTTERELRGEVAVLTAERTDALDALAALDADLASLRQQLLAAQDGAEGLAGQVGVLEARIASVSEQRNAAQGSVDALDAELVLTQQELAGTQQELATTRQRLTDVTADRDAFARLFPMQFAPSIVTGDITGVYDVDATWIYCVGLANCGSTPSMSDLTIRKTAEGYLRANIPGFVEGGLFRADGALHLVADSTVAVPACAGVARTAGVTMTIFPGGYELGRDGTQTITQLSAVITVEAPAVGTCPAVLAFTSVDLTPRA